MKHFPPPRIDGTIRPADRWDRRAAPPPATATRWARLRATLVERRLALFLLLFAALPLLWPSVPPLVDLPNHISRYTIAIDYASVPQFRRWFEVHDVLVGNLGVDLIAGLIGPWLGVEATVKLVAIAIPVLTVAGLIAIARKVHGKVGAFTAFAATFAYNFPFNFGFLNYCLSVALALVAFGLWLRLGGRRPLRAALFAPIGFALWVCHTSGWGIFGLMVFAWEFADARLRGEAWWRAAAVAVRESAVLALPLVPMLLWSSHLPGGPAIGFSYAPMRKLAIFFLALRDGVPIVDALSVLVPLGIAILTITRRDLGIEPRLGAVGLVLILAYLAMPSQLLGSTYTDMRIAPYAMMLLLLALRPTASTRFTRAIAVLAPCLFAGEMLYHAANYLRIDRVQQHQLAAIDHIPVGSTVFALARVSCDGEMAGNRLNHVARLAITRRHAFTNNSWAYPGTQTVLARPAMTAGYFDESSSSLKPATCRRRPDQRLGGALRRLPRDRFRYLWLLDVPQRGWPRRPWLHMIWHHDSGALYAIDPPARSRQS